MEVKAEKECEKKNPHFNTLSYYNSPKTQKTYNVEEEIEVQMVSEPLERYS